MPDLLEELAVSTEIDTDNGDHDRFAHYVSKDEIVEATVMGWPVIALCGKIWVPDRDPSKYPICPTCKEIFDSLGLTT